MKLRLVAVDMDGTCVAGGHRGPDRNIWALEQAWRAGAVVVPATGRPLSGYPVPLKRLPWIRYVISSNGARLTDRLTGKDLRQALIPAAEAVSLLRALKGTAVWISVHKDGICLDKNRIPFWHRRLFYHGDFAAGRRIGRLEAWLEEEGGGVEKLQVFFLTEAARRRTTELLKRRPHLACCESHSRYVEVTAADASKGAALRALCERLGIAPNEVMAIGDSDNDLSMFRYAGCPVAMGNAPASVKEEACEATAGNRRCGVAWAVMKRLRESGAKDEAGDGGKEKSC